MEIEEKVLRKIGKKVKKSKKKEMSVTEEISDCKAVEAAELKNNLKFRVIDKKKDTIYHMVRDGLTLNSDSYGNFDTECSDVLPPDEASSLRLNKEYKEMEKKKKREVCGDVMLDQIFGGPEKKRAKKRKLGTGENNDALKEETETDDRLSKGNSYGQNKEEQDVQHQLLEDESNVLSINKTEKRVESKSAEKEGITKTKDTGDRDVSNKNRKIIGNEEDDSVKGKKNITGRKNIEKVYHDKVAVDKAKRKKRKTDKTKDMYGHANKAKHAETTNRKKRKNKIKSVESDTENPKPRQKREKVKFADCIEVFPSSGVRNSVKVEDLIQGKRFSPEEDKLVKAAVLDYIKSHDLGEKGLDMVMRCQSHPEVRKCWKDIAAFIPNRPRVAVYRRAHILFEAGERHKWTEEELDLIQKHQNKRQENCRNDWKGLGEELGLYRYRLKDTWRRIKLSNRNKGCWSQEEYQNLFNLVNKDLQIRTFNEKKSKHGMLRDNISWEEVSGNLSTRSNANCCLKWYKQLTSSLVAEGKWADSDDYRMLDALFKLDACCIEDVNWDNLIDNRSGDICRKRWDQMVLHIGLHQNKSFAEQVEILGKRYCPSLLEAKEIWDNKPFVP